MYFSIGILIFAILIIIVSGTCRRRHAIKKVCSMDSAEKCRLLSSLIEPFGYCYNEKEDIISSRNDAWQREAGYTSLYDRAAPFFNMVFDYLPVCFPYQNRTWLIEFWKGQYGINTGAEIGVYYADRLLEKDELPAAMFRAVEDKDMLPVSFCLAKEDAALASVSKITWWLTAFKMGLFSKPSQLCMTCSIHFPNCEMMQNFLDSLLQTGILKECVCICGNTVHIRYCGPQHRVYGCFTLLARKWAQFWNRIFCKIYLFLTRYFCSTIDRLLYLYYLLPFAFRRMLRPRRYCKYRPKRRRFPRQH